MTKKRFRCAVYTRKSTEEGLDQEFNSLDAQREACEAYIKSQVHEGWTLVRERYDDGGLSGATMNRPALGRLLAEIQAGRVDTVAVYKVDRLTRALSDFARLVEIFDSQHVSFVSVTQQFNTTTSMGRLTLNVLLSFAQFEREVTAERIRDKIGASKKKGMWMGGVVPLGYDAIEKKLVVNAREAETVQTIFRLYLECGNVRRLKEKADQAGLRTKGRKPNNGERSGGETFTRGHLYKLLSNPIYIGEVAHKGERFCGEHAAIIDRETWEKVEQGLRHNGVVRHGVRNARNPSLPAGLLVGENGERLTPCHASKGGRRYRYYVSQSPSDETSPRRGQRRLPAVEIEAVVVREISKLLRDPSRVLGVLGLSSGSAERVSEILERAAELGNRLPSDPVFEKSAVLRAILVKVHIGPDSLRFIVNRPGLAAACGSATMQLESRVDDAATFDVPVRPKRRGVETKLVLRDGTHASATPDPVLIEALSKAHVWFEQLRNGEVRSVRDLARRVGCDRADVGRTLRLAFLAPDIVEAILDGRHPVALTATRLKRLSNLPLAWSDQRNVLGFDR